MQHLQPNTTLQGGKYVIERVLGQGGFGITYLATQISLNRYVAIKELFIGGSGQAINDRRGNQVVVTNSANQSCFTQQKEKFKKEALRLAKLNHPNLVKVHELFEENGTAYYAMDYIDGESLRTKLNREGCLSEKLALKYIQQILLALEVAHEQSIWHLDIKPENIMVDRWDHAYLIDFGASKHIEQEGAFTTSLVLAYTRGYCPPELADLTYESKDELIQALKEIGPWTDIYALGATLYNILTDSTPPSSNRLYQVGRKAFLFPNNLSTSTKDIIVWMMMPNREERPQCIKEFQRQLYSSSSSNKESTIGYGNTLNNVPNTISVTSFLQPHDMVKKNDNLFVDTAETESTLAILGSKPHIESIAKNLFQYDNRGDVLVSEGLACVYRHGKGGYIDMDGIEVIPCVFDNVYPFYGELARVKKDNKYGWINKKGNVVIPIIYDYSYNFSEGLAFVKKGNKLGGIDMTGKEVIPFVYDGAYWFFSCGLASVKINGKWGFIDKNGKIVIPFIYDNTTVFSDSFIDGGFAIVQKDNQYGCIDRKGNEFISIGKYERVIVTDSCCTLVKDGLLPVMRNEKYGFCDKEGKETVPCVYDYVSQFSEGYAAVENTNWAYIDKDGYLVTKFEFFEANDFEDGYAVVQNANRRYGVVDKNFNEFIPYEYQEIFQREGFSVKSNGKWGFMDINRKIIHPCVYDNRIWFQEGFAFVRKNGVLGCLDMEGRSTFDYLNK